jgi:hypothetical protein
MAFPHTLDSMSKVKVPETGAGYLGETMVHRVSHAMGVVENVIEAKAGWPPEITLKLPDGTFKKGKLSDFREPNSAERKKVSPARPVGIERNSLETQAGDAKT